MRCQTVRKSISAFVDRQLSEEESRGITKHLAGCRECAILSKETLRVRTVLCELPSVVPPSRLASQLRVLASRERARRLARVSISAAVACWGGRLRLMFDNLMKPLALPFAGGLASALFMFGVLVPTLGFPHNFRDDVPTVFRTDASVQEMAPFGFNNDVIVELTIDERGRMVDYSVAQGQMSREILSSIGNMMLFSTYTPATWFGQPTSGKVRVSFRRSRININIRG